MKRIAGAVAGGLLVALSVPPAGFWPLGILGVALLVFLLDSLDSPDSPDSPHDAGWRRRALLGFAAGMGLYAVTIFWFAEFNAIGAVLSMMVEAAFLALAAAVSPPGRWRGVAFVGALVLSEWLRTYIPFGGVPLGGIPLGQAAGPLAPAARVGGQLLVSGVVALLAVALAYAARRDFKPVAATALAAAVLVAWGRWTPPGHRIGSMRIAAVQGGGRRGLRAIHSSALAVVRAQFDASRRIAPPVDLILWPEDVISVAGTLAASPVGPEVGTVATRFRAPLIAGITEDSGPEKFRNAMVLWDSNGHITGRYDKVHRVPFGEYIPGRFLVKHLVNLDVIPRDAVPGHGTGELTTESGPVGIVISFEVFFPARARSAIRAGGQVLLAPTNTASYTTSQVPSAEVAADRLRAWETGRDVVMVAPTGWSAVVDAQGRLLQRSGLGPAAVIEATVPRRTGSTPYVRWGDIPAVLLGFVLVGGAWELRRRAAST